MRSSAHVDATNFCSRSPGVSVDHLRDRHQCFQDIYHTELCLPERTFSTMRATCNPLQSCELLLSCCHWSRSSEVSLGMTVRAAPEAGLINNLHESIWNSGTESPDVQAVRVFVVTGLWQSVPMCPPPPHAQKAGHFASPPLPPLYTTSWPFPMFLCHDQPTTAVPAVLDPPFVTKRRGLMLKISCVQLSAVTLKSTRIHFNGATLPSSGHLLQFPKPHGFTN